MALCSRPNFKQGGGIADQVTGKVEEIKGKILKKPELVEHGHKVGTGELAREELKKETEAKDKEANPFANADEKKTDDKKPAAEGAKEDKAEDKEAKVQDKVQEKKNE